MKTNAIIRIAAYSLAIVILLGILVVGIGAEQYIFTGPVESTGGDSYMMASSAVEPDSIKELEIEWVAGNIQLTADPNTDMITFSESQVSDPDEQLVYRISDGKLSIQYCKESMEFISFGIQTKTSKDLTITVPQDWVCRSLEIDAAAANVSVDNMVIDEIDFDGASGICTFDGCIVKDIQMDTASGDIRFNGFLDNIGIEAVSANCTLDVQNTPQSIDLNSVSGDLELILPADCGFSVSIDAMSSDFTSEFATTLQNGHHIYGDGSCRIRIDGMSGDINVRKGQDTSYSAVCNDANCTDASHYHRQHHSNHHG